MTEFYVYRHIHSKSHFTKKLFQTEPLQKTLKLAKGIKSKSTRVIHTEYEQYRIHGDTIKKCSHTDDEDSSLTARRSLPAVGGLEVTNKTVSQNVGIIQPEAKDHISVTDNCKTPGNVQEYKVQGDTLKKYRHEHSNVLLEGCSDTEPDFACTPDLRDQVKQRLYESQDQVGNQDFDYNPQNMMSAIGFDYDWDIENIFASEETNQAYPLMQDTEMPQEMFAEQSTEFPTKSEFPIEVVNGVFQADSSTSDHMTATSTYKNP